MNKEEIKKRVSLCQGSLLSFPDRGPWGSNLYRGNFSGWIPATLINRYKAKSVAEIFAGGGTTSDVCKDLEIPYIGVDLNPNPVRKDIVSMDILDEQISLPDGFYQADLQILHPPYPSINGIHYSNCMWKGKNLQTQDIQEMSWEKGMNAINKAIMRGYSAMPKGSLQAVVCGDVRRKVDGKSVFRSMMTNLVIPGEMVQLLIKEQHNTVSGRNSSYNNLSFFLIEHEYIVVIKKPSGFEIAFTIPKKYTTDLRDAKSSTWKDVVYTTLRELRGEQKLEAIYSQIDGHKKAQNNTHWKEKVRQVLQQLKAAGLVTSSERGTWSVI